MQLLASVNETIWESISIAAILTWSYMNRVQQIWRMSQSMRRISIRINLNIKLILLIRYRILSRWKKEPGEMFYLKKNTQELFCWLFSTSRTRGPAEPLKGSVLVSVPSLAWATRGVFGLIITHILYICCHFKTGSCSQDKPVWIQINLLHIFVFCDHQKAEKKGGIMVRKVICFASSAAVTFF